MTYFIERYFDLHPVAGWYPLPLNFKREADALNLAVSRVAYTPGMKLRVVSDLHGVIVDDEDVARRAATLARDMREKTNA